MTQLTAKDDPSRDAKIEHHKSDSIKKAKEGDGEWKPELASNSEQAVAGEKSDMSIEEMQKVCRVAFVLWLVGNRGGGMSGRLRGFELEGWEKHKRNDTLTFHRWERRRLSRGSSRVGVVRIRYD